MYMASLNFEDTNKLPELSAFETKRLKMVSGYDLLDRLSRRRQYMKSNVREKTSLSDGFTSVPEMGMVRNLTQFDLYDSDMEFQIDGLGLMERTGLDPRRSRSTPWFEDTRTTYQHHAEYLKRLSNLREELISQEQTNLANALERLRMRQNGKENSIAKQKFREISTDAAYPRRSLLTTSEQFQRMRPKKLPPHISPLEGKQIIEPQTSRSSRSPQFNDKTAFSPVPNSARNFEEKFRANLQRVIQPTSSIPNIGRKSTSQSKDLVLESSPIQKTRTSKRLKDDQAHTQETNPFKAVHKNSTGRLRSLVRPDSDELDLSPQAIKFENLNERDKVNLEKLKEYYCIYYLPNNSPVPPEEEDSTPRNGGSDIVINHVEHEGFDSQKKKRISLLEGKSIFPNSNKNNSTRKKKERRDSVRSRHTKSYENFENQQNYPISETPSRRQIVVDMPSIVFNSATPDRRGDEFKLKRSPTLTKTVKQNELRQKELRNLLEDVKEINKRTDKLSDYLSDQPNEGD